MDSIRLIVATYYFAKHILIAYPIPMIPKKPHLSKCMAILENLEPLSYRNSFGQFEVWQPRTFTEFFNSLELSLDSMKALKQENELILPVINHKLTSVQGFKSNKVGWYQLGDPILRNKLPLIIRVENNNNKGFETYLEILDREGLVEVSHKIFTQTVKESPENRDFYYLKLGIKLDRESQTLSFFLNGAPNHSSFTNQSTQLTVKYNSQSITGLNLLYVNSKNHK